MTRRAAFITWMIGFPLSCSAQKFLEFHGGAYSDSYYSADVLGIAALFLLTVWLFVGVLIWREGN